MVLYEELLGELENARLNNLSPKNWLMHPSDLADRGVDFDFEKHNLFFDQQTGDWSAMGLKVELDARRLPGKIELVTESN